MTPKLLEAIKDPENQEQDNRVTLKQTLKKSSNPNYVIEQQGRETMRLISKTWEEATMKRWNIK